MSKPSFHAGSLPFWGGVCLFLLEVSNPVVASDSKRPPMFEEEAFVLKSRGHEFSEMGRYEDAARDFEQYLELYPGDDSVRISYAETLAIMRRHAEAIEIMRQVLERNPEHEVLKFKLGREYIFVKRYEEAAPLFESLKHSKNPDLALAADAALSALRRDQIQQARWNAENRLYELLRENQDSAALEWLEKIEADFPQGLPAPLQMERIYILQRMGRYDRALEIAAGLAEAGESNPDFKLLYADLLARTGQFTKAIQTLKEVESDHAGAPHGRMGRRQRFYLPASQDPRRWAWGEGYTDATYLGRFGTVIGSGSIRQGTFMPGARWLQPFAGFQFLVDSRSERTAVGGLSSIFSENLAAIHTGIRAVPFRNENFQIYATGGFQKDLLAAVNEGEWFPDFRVGVSGYQGWGPGLVLADVLSRVNEAERARLATRQDVIWGPWIWRTDWLTEFGGDFSWYERLDNAIGYAQGREGVRFAQFGNAGGLDAYVLQNLSFDSNGNFFDNLGEIGLGTRTVMTPFFGWTISGRVEWIEGFYFGRNEIGGRGDRDTEYEEIRVGIAISTIW
jgi:tetratricopeptide (TPR) repeat protein